MVSTFTKNVSRGSISSPCSFNHARMPSASPSFAPGNTSHVSMLRGARSCRRRPTSSSAATPEALVEAPGETSEIAASTNSIT
jgi:hypothetical protein